MRKSTNLFSKQNNEKATIDAVNTNISETKNANKELRSDIASINNENKEIKFLYYGYKEISTRMVKEV